MRDSQCNFGLAHKPNGSPVILVSLRQCPAAHRRRCGILEAIGKGKSSASTSVAKLLTAISLAFKLANLCLRTGLQCFGRFLPWQTAMQDREQDSATSQPWGQQLPTLAPRDDPTSSPRRRPSPSSSGRRPRLSHRSRAGCWTCRGRKVSLQSSYTSCNHADRHPGEMRREAPSLWSMRLLVCQ